MHTSIKAAIIGGVFVVVAAIISAQWWTPSLSQKPETNPSVQVNPNIQANPNINIQVNPGNQQVTVEEKNKLSPKLNIDLSPDLAKDNPYKYPLHEYRMLIQNENENSVPIQDLRTKFFFYNNVHQVEKRPMIVTGGVVSFSGLRVIEHNKTGSKIVLEEQPVDDYILKSFFLTIQPQKVSDRQINTNIVLFTVERWPEKVGFLGDIIVDLSKKPTIKGENGTYEGMYFYTIRGEKFEEKINGSFSNVNQNEVRQK